MDAVLEVKDLDKSFVGVHAVDHVSFQVYPGTVHVMQGENGAGKSTILKMLSGLYQPDSGEILLHGKPVSFSSPQDAKEKGIAMVYQEMTILPELTVAQNIFLHQEEQKGRFLDEASMMKKARELAEKYDIEIDPYCRAGDLEIAQQQMIEILKALASDSEILILDEPTSSLARKEVDRLYEIVEGLKKKGKTILFISHRMEEIFRFGDNMTVMKDGKYVGSVAIKDVTEDDIIRMMVGRDLDDIFPPKLKEEPGEEIFRVEDLSDKDKVHQVSFSIRSGEVLGIAALDGQGQNEIMRLIAGIRKKTSGRVYLKGQELHYRNPRQALAAGIGYVPEDRKKQGLSLLLSVRENIAMSSLKRRQKASFINLKEEMEVVRRMIEVMRIKTPGPEQAVVNLSGGNQQKVSIGKSLADEPQVLLLNEPTRGIDVEAKQEIYKLIRSLAGDGVGILVYTSDMMECIGLCDRIMTVYEGRITSVLTQEQHTEEIIMKGAMNLGEEKNG